jgi:hypothetical protein
VVLAAGSLYGLLIPADLDRRLTDAGAGLVNALPAILLLTANVPFIYYWGRSPTWSLRACVMLATLPLRSTL